MGGRPQSSPFSTQQSEGRFGSSRPSAVRRSGEMMEYAKGFLGGSMVFFLCAGGAK